MLVYIVLVILILAVLYWHHHSLTRISTDTHQLEFAQRMGWQIKNSSTVTYLGLGKMGRMGNQMFEIAATVAIAKQNQCQVIFPLAIKELPIFKLFNLDLPVTNSKLVPKKSFPETSCYDQPHIPNDGYVYAIEGYRQSREYLEPIWQKLPELFKLKHPLSLQNAIGIHIRRTDYIKPNPVLNAIDPPLNCTLKYYQESIADLRAQHNLSPDYPVIVATDDRKWVQKHLTQIDTAARLTSKDTLEHDFKTLAASKYLVIPNSTFSLWAAFLNKSIRKHAHRIVAPSYWVNPSNYGIRLTDAHLQNVCLSNWCFHDPITGEKVKTAYQHCTQEYSNNWLRALWMLHFFR